MIKCYKLKPTDKVIECEMGESRMMGVLIKDKLWFNFDDIIQHLGIDLFSSIIIYKKLVELGKEVIMIGVYGTDYTFISEDDIYEVCDNDEDFEFFIADLYVNLKYKCKR